MRSLSSSRVRKVHVAAVLVATFVIGSATSVAAKKPSPPPPSSPSASVTIAPSGVMAPDGESVVVDVTATCPVGWTFSYGRLYVLKTDGTGGSGTFSGTCTGSPQVARAKAINGNRFQLGNWTGAAYLGIARNGQQVQVSSTRTIRLEPGVTARVAAQGQLAGTSGGGVRIAVDVACPIGTIVGESYLAVSQGGTALGRAFFTPTCDRQTHTVVLSITASQGTFHTGSAVGDAFVNVSWNGEAFFGVDNRAITLLESSTGDTTAPTTPAGLSANVFGDGETWLSWAASTDNATPSALLVYEVRLNGRVDQTIGGGSTQAILYAEMGVLNTIEVIAIDGAGNRSAPATVTVDLR